MNHRLNEAESSEEEEPTLRGAKSENHPLAH